MKCCLCKSSIEEESHAWKGGHNPYPIKEKGRCCGICNNELVVPTRLVLSLGISMDKAKEIMLELPKEA